MPANTRIICPKCGHEFNVEDVLAQQIEEKYRNEMNQSITKIQEEYALKENAIKQKEADLKRQQTYIDQLVSEKLKSESEKAARLLKSQFEQQYEGRLKTLSEEAESAKKEISDLKIFVKISRIFSKVSLNDTFVEFLLQNTLLIHFCDCPEYLLYSGQNELDT